MIISGTFRASDIMQDEHLPRAIPSNVKDYIKDAVGKKSLVEIHSNFYTHVASTDDIFDQGNGIKALPFVSPPVQTFKPHNVLVISNSCDAAFVRLPI